VVWQDFSKRLAVDWNIWGGKGGFPIRLESSAILYETRNKWKGTFENVVSLNGCLLIDVGQFDIKRQSAVPSPVFFALKCSRKILDKLAHLQGVAI